jgi:hypothetical protein
MQQYNMLQAFYMSFYSRNLYRDVAKNWGGKTFLYLLLLLTLAWVPFTIQLQMQVNKAYKDHADEIVHQVPMMTIKEGKLSTPENRPYIITDPKSQKKLAVIDTSGKYTTIEQADAVMLVTQTQIIDKAKKNEVRIHEIPKTLDTTIDPHRLNIMVKNFIGFMWIFVFIACLLVSFFYRIIQAVVYSVIGKIISAISGIPVTYGQIIQIMLVGITPVIVLSTIIEFFSWHFAFHNLFYFLLAISYMVYGIFANKDEKQSV